MLPTTTSRVTRHSSIASNERIRRAIEQRLQYFAHHPERIGVRLRELDREWDIERVLETNAASLGVLSFVMGLGGSRKWFLLSGLVSGFLLQHALQGWCPPVPLLRRLGVRTQSEIEFERYMLKALRGDLGDLSRAAGTSHDVGEDVRRMVEEAPASC